MYRFKKTYVKLSKNWFWKYGWLVLIALFLAGRYIYFMPKFDGGELAPVFEASLRDGQHFDLEQWRGSYVIVHFWGSWCGPCRRNNPAMVQLYENLHRGAVETQHRLEIVSIGIETDSNRWARAIEKDGLIWPYHISSFKRFDDPIARLYGVREIPSYYLLDPKGVILAHNPSPESVISLVKAGVN